MAAGRNNIVVGLVLLATFMLVGFALAYMQHLAPNTEQWNAAYATGMHLESRMAHAHGTLFALINIAVGLVLLRAPMSELAARWISWLGLAGLLMPIGIAIQVVVDIPPVLVIVGGAAMIGCLGWLALRVGTTSEA
jgi:hypothetical protein